MTIQVGDKIPEAILTIMSDDGPKPLTTSDWFGGRKVVLFSVPGAFTPTCSARHLPGFIDHIEDIRSKGIDAIGCTAVNDVFVMDAWRRNSGAAGIDMLADGNAEFAEALGLAMDATSYGMGQRGQRFALVAEDGVVTALYVEQPGEFKVSSAEHVLANL
ncbi:peroxiredoxin [Marinihelvus fidelis]|uniref:Glutathione-dependent peroxiredoxin n=1 Tax=Marinihelvus fidelis TaxID=2613842 RepID=A0A5N0TE52_9GAMM|nr:peroxiredoxin [Marinihelvus fidelis]KAA9133305.1 peroxiredoxin [Marinihelvus fidelis]